MVEKRDVVRQMTKEAWNAYAKYAWGANELKPLSKKPHQASVLGGVPLGATIIDGMDTLYIMGLHEEFKNARDFVAEKLNFDQVFLDQAVNLADRLLPAFNSTTGIPYSLINLHDGFTKQFSWSLDRCSILSECGTMHMEFTYLSELTGDAKYAKVVNTIRESVSQIPRPNGLFYNYLNPRTGSWCGQNAGLSALGDSFYEYLLKEWIRTDGADIQGRQLYDIGLQALFNNGVFKKSAADNLFLGSYHHGTVNSVMDHLACFAGGMLALGSSGPNDVWFDRGIRITNTCRLSYENTVTHLGPESFEFGKNIEAVPIRKAHKTHLLRPETVESYFYLWRFTKNPIYREWAWDVVQALISYTNTSTGYSGLIDVNRLQKNWDDVQQSFFIAETLKYLYLIFSEDTLLPLDRWVFNSEAHPFPVHNRVILGDTNWPKLHPLTKQPKPVMPPSQSSISSHRPPPLPQSV
ncbi:Mannosyl-oligosaccharide 1 2-alpha-mannosidase IA [Fasciola hepatica]|uniref:alpha-1,2-Mannosidase n=1 Tax=Fasciola hepatica TaxID=6192 RepID=A0A4E0RMK8_FASHE|nr:Mannosyl-oligosaccharide 1 2-alpha-mannosidase IA [Fasciola hepatica]